MPEPLLNSSLFCQKKTDSILPWKVLKYGWSKVFHSERVTSTYLLHGKIIVVREHTSLMLGFYPINIIFVLACKMMPAAVACHLQAASEKILVSYIYGPCFTNLSITSLTSISSSITVSTIYSGTIIMRLLERYHLHSPGFTRNGISFFPPKYQW